MIKSQFGWVDFSASDRSRVQYALKQLSEPGTLDELGIGGLRDGFADLMFPGFSTIQTRAKYFITVPRILRDYLALSAVERRKLSPGAYLKEHETYVADALKAAHPDGEQKGIIGVTMEDGQTVARLPSSVYWVGLRTWGLVNSHASLNQFLHTFTPQDEFSGSLSLDEPDDVDAGTIINRVNIDRYIPDWRKHLTITLTSSESDFLSNKLRTGPCYSLPRQFELCDLRAQALIHTDFPSLAAWIGRCKVLPAHTRETVKMAQAFSELIYGAHLRFNIVLAKKNKRNDLLESLEEKWEAWRQQPQGVPDDIDMWIARTDVRLRYHTRVFLKKWCVEAPRKGSEDLLDLLVVRQADDNKKERSVLHKHLPESYQWVGIERLNYRWWQVRTILTDIQEGQSC